MCGRYTLRTPASELVEIFRLLREPPLAPRYNIAPTQPVAVVRQSDTFREWALLHWGLIPSWSKDPKLGARMINARSETVTSKPSFRAAFRRRRCLIPADGFFEWRQTGGQRGGRLKQPMYIGMRDDRPFAFAGLWEHWSGGDGSEIESCTIITTTANELLRDIHERMPVILPEEKFADWLDPKAVNIDRLQAMLAPYPAEEMTFYPVGTTVNTPRNDSPVCIEPVEEQGLLFGES